MTGQRIDQPLNRVAGEATTVQARRGKRSITYHIRCLPTDFPTWRVRESGTPQAEWYLTTPETTTPMPTYVAIFDDHGVPVWWKHSGGQAVNATLLPHNRIAWAIRHMIEDPEWPSILEGIAAREAEVPRTAAFFLKHGLDLKDLKHWTGNP